jgi:hypothetical protein
MRNSNQIVISEASIVTAGLQLNETVGGTRTEPD